MVPFGVSSMMRLQVDCINSWSCDDMKTFPGIFYQVIVESLNGFQIEVVGRRVKD